jgi:pimeloyl-ACP methyl ester carboxylesterase
MADYLVKCVETDTLRIAYVGHGPDNGWPVILSHGFPYDIHAFDEVAPVLAAAGARVILPYTRGFGPTRFLSDTARPRQLPTAPDHFHSSRLTACSRLSNSSDQNIGQVTVADGNGHRSFRGMTGTAALASHCEGSMPMPTRRRKQPP